MINIGVNGFGCIGRSFVRIALEKCKEKPTPKTPRVVAINDAKLNSDCIQKMLKYDTVYGKFKCDVVDAGACIMVDGQRIATYQERKINKIPWKKDEVHYVVDTVSSNNTMEKALIHLNQGVKRIVVCGLCDVPTFVLGVNHESFDLKMKVVSPGSASLNCLVPLLKVLYQNFDLQKVMVTGLYPRHTADRYFCGTTERSCRDFRLGLTVAPTQSSTPMKSVVQIMPELMGKIASVAMRVPLNCVGAIDVTADLGCELHCDDIRCKVKHASDTYMKGIMCFNTDEIVSGDVIGDPHACVFDGKAGASLPGGLSKLLAWHDTRYAYAHTLYDLISYISSRENVAAPC